MHVSKVRQVSYEFLLRGLNGCFWLDVRVSLPLEKRQAVEQPSQFPQGEMQRGAAAS
ncbi:hypothetical protein WJ0W_003165 [Paenibacillus melissococcoides]|uniref:Uncharacterized protein n=1 Tax=Paenibacillus melissococcoides TaxID=2912268 RepID=A0ABM9G2U9_9BACL|nr:hypothetical protein [Paenibacillus dendritiformis]MEB9892277.1 hypothetical protein [Bacillus cereus]CAH8245930.1 hypothetical protein WJ0W_003165 [Paenibacillus melissococcoides]